MYVRYVYVSLKCGARNAAVTIQGNAMDGGNIQPLISFVARVVIVA